MLTDKTQAQVVVVNDCNQLVESTQRQNLSELESLCAESFHAHHTVEQACSMQQQQLTAVSADLQSQTDEIDVKNASLEHALAEAEDVSARLLLRNPKA